LAFKEIASLDADKTITLGGVDKKTGKKNPTKIEGYFLGTRETGPNKFNRQRMDVVHVFQTPEGNVAVWGKTDLDTKLKAVYPGRMVRATFTGSVPTNKGNDMLKYKIEVDDANSIDVSDIAAAGASDESEDSEEQGGYTGDVEGEDEGSEPEPVPIVASKLKSTAAERAAKVKELLSKKN
jgi:hypothetical protein